MLTICKSKCPDTKYVRTLNLSFSLVFFAGGKTAPDMSLLFIDIQHLPYLFVEEAVILGQSLLQVFMYRGF